MVTKKEKMLAFDVEARKTWEEVEEEYREELDGRWALVRPDLFGYACGATVDVETGEADRFGPGDSEKMLTHLDGADLIVTCREVVSELGILGVPFNSALRENTCTWLGYDFAETDGFLWSGKGEEGAVLFAEGRIEELLDLSERRARWTAEAYRAARHLQTGSPRPSVECDDGTRASRTLWNIHLGFGWGLRRPY